jgi:hypothetical protein
MNPSTGSLNYLLNNLTGTVWASEQHQMGLYSYQTFNQSQFETFQTQYNSYCPPFCGVPDFVKPHLNGTYSESKHWHPILEAAYVSSDQCHIVAKMISPVNASLLYGSPANLFLNFKFQKSEDSKVAGATKLHVDLQWFNKTATRLPEAAFMSFTPALQSRNWWMQKLESWVSPYDVAVSTFDSQTCPSNRFPFLLDHSTIPQMRLVHCMV